MPTSCSTRSPTRATRPPCPSGHRGIGHCERHRGRQGGRAARPAQAALGSDRALGAGGADRDDPAAAVRLLAVAEPAARDPGRLLVRSALPSCRLAEPPPSHGVDGHADLARHARRLDLVGGGAPVPRRGRAGDADDLHAGPRARIGVLGGLLRGRRPGDDVHPRRPLLRGEGQAPRRRSARGPARARRQGRRRTRRRRQRATDPERPAGGRRSVPGPARREARDRRDRRVGQLGRRRLASHRRIDPGRGRARRRGHRRDRQRRRPADRPGDAGRRRHRSRPDRPPRHRGADGQGARAAPRRPRIGRVRPDRDRRWPSSRSATGSPPARAPPTR